jgi:hypothetical protein
LSIGKLIKKLNKSETIFVGNGGPHLSRLPLSTADYKHGKMLKSCYAEFCLHPQCGFFYFKNRLIFAVEKYDKKGQS